MTCPYCGCPRTYGRGDMRTCANPQCAKWIVPGAEPVLVADTPPAAPVERTVTIADKGRGRGKRKGKR